MRPWRRRRHSLAGAKRREKKKKALALESADFAKQCVQLYESVASLAVKPQLTPHLDVSTLPAADDETRGQLTESAARTLMKILWHAMVGSTEPSGPAGCRYNTCVPRLLVEQERRSASPQVRWVHLELR